MIVKRKWSVPDSIEEQELLKKAQSGDDQARDDLITRNIPFIIKESKRLWCIRNVTWLEYDDFFQSAILGMFHAIYKWDVEKTNGGRFIGYAKYWIRNYIDAEIHYSKSYRIPLATIYNIKTDKVKNQKLLDAVSRFSNMIYVDMNDDDQYGMADNFDLVEHKEDLCFLQKQISVLSEEQKDLLEGKLQGQTLSHIGKKYGYTGQMVRRRLNDIIKILRDKFRQSYPKESFLKK